MAIYGYLRASTDKQDALRAEQALMDFASSNGFTLSLPLFVENESGAKLDRPALFSLLEIAQKGDVMLIEAVDRLSRLNADDWNKLRSTINEKGIRVVALDLPTSWMLLNAPDEFTSRMFEAINNLMLDMLAAIARKDYESRKERCKQGIERAKAKGVKFGRKQDETIDREAVKQDLASGLTMRAVAAKHGVSLGTVQNIKNS